MVASHLTATFAVFISLSVAVLAQESEQPSQAQDLKRLSIEELAAVEVTSVSRRTER